MDYMELALALLYLIVATRSQYGTNVAKLQHEDALTHSALDPGHSRTDHCTDMRAGDLRINDIPSCNPSKSTLHPPSFNDPILRTRFFFPGLIILTHIIDILHSSL